MKIPPPSPTALARVKQAIPTTVSTVITVMLAAAFWFSTTPLLAGGGSRPSKKGSGAQPNGAQQQQCQVCHKRTTTLTLVCGSLEYRRHIDHGDTMGACVTPVQNQ